jgi:hypothetical protein
MKYFSLRYLVFTASFLMLSFACYSLDLNPRKIMHCGSKAEKEMKAALKFLDNNINGIINRVSDLTKNEKKRLKRKLKNLNFKCMDHKRVCKNKADRGGRSRHIFKQAVVICYNNIRKLLEEDAFCQLTDTLIHEAAHAARVTKARRHNDGPNTDRVYRVGFAAFDICEGKGLNRAIKKNTNN